jgi:hypothetical protein
MLDAAASASASNTAASGCPKTRPPAISPLAILIGSAR